MNAKLLARKWLIALLAGALLAGCGKQQEKPAEVKSPLEKQGSKQLVFVGDTQKRVYEMLGSPSIEFPDGGTMVQWYAGYEIVVSNNVVTDVHMKQVESEAEKLEKEQ